MIADFKYDVSVASIDSCRIDGTCCAASQDAIVVGLARKESSEHAGTLQSLCWGSRVGSVTLRVPYPMAQSNVPVSVSFRDVWLGVPLWRLTKTQQCCVACLDILWR